MISEGSKVLLLDHDGRRYVFAAERRMLEVGRLGVVDGAKICDSSVGDTLSIGGREFLILKPSLKDLLETMGRKAQIMIPKDSFVIPFHLDIGSGSKIVEAGVGSGGLTLVLLRAVAPTGRVCSYDLRDDHGAVAKRNISMSEQAGCWELRIGDICSMELERDFDAAFLDMPNPWDAIDNVTKALKVGGHLGCYIPNANQLDKTVRKMREAGLAEVVAFETIQREMVVHEGGVRPSFDMLGHTGYLAFGRKLKKLD